MRRWQEERGEPLRQRNGLDGGVRVVDVGIVVVIDVVVLVAGGAGDHRKRLAAQLALGA